MNLDRKKFRIATSCLSLAGIVAAVLRLITYWKELDPATGFFTGSAPFCTIYNVIGFVVFALCLLLSLTKGEKDEKKRRTPEPEDDSALFVGQDEEVAMEEELPGEFLKGTARKSAVWEGTLSSFATFLPGFGFLAYAISFVVNPAVKADSYHLLFALLSALSGVYFIFTGIANSAKKSTVRPFLALIPALWSTVRMVVEYRDLARYVNKSLYIGQFLFITSTLIFFLYQAQLLFGERGLDKPNSYSFCALLPAWFGLTARLPQLIAVLGDRVVVDLVDAASLLIDLAITLFILLKIQAIWKTRE